MIQKCTKESPGKQKCYGTFCTIEKKVTSFGAQAKVGVASKNSARIKLSYSNILTFSNT